MTAEVQHSDKAPTNDYPSWGPRFWHGMRTTCWWRLLRQNGFRIAPSRMHIAFGVSFFTPLNDLLALAQAAIFGRKIERTQVTRDPIFILGHWRSGTTFLHELLVSDPQFASPNTFQCFAPSHFLLSEYLMIRFGNFLIPKKRPMDNMEAGWQLPQEDEFALMNLGAPSPYLRIAFPKTQPELLEYLDLRELNPTELQIWCDKFMWFIKVLTHHYAGKQLVLKSPPHTGRIGTIVEMFPNAKFIHLTRDPRNIYASTLRLWKSLDRVQALQTPAEERRMKQYVVECMQRMYAGFHEAERRIPQENIVTIRYEDLVESPSNIIEGLYEKLSLGDFETLKPQLAKRLANHSSYRTNRHRLDKESEEEIAESWGEYLTRYGYETVQS